MIHTITYLVIFLAVIFYSTGALSAHLKSRRTRNAYVRSDLIQWRDRRIVIAVTLLGIGVLDVVAGVLL